MSIPALEWEIRVPEELQERFSQAARFDIGWTPEGYAWVFPKREHLSVGILSMRRGAAQLKRQLTAYLADVGVDEIHEAERHGFVIPVRPRQGGLVKGRVLLVGDTAGLADPVTAEGISHALLSGRLAAEAIIEGRSDPWLVQQLYEERVERQILSELRAARKLAWALYRVPRWRSWFMKRFGDDFAEAMAAVISGERTYRDIVMRPRTYWTVLERRLSRRPHRSH
jgi:flavin-dependent dehydrogenase